MRTILIRTWHWLRKLDTFFCFSFTGLALTLLIWIYSPASKPRLVITQLTQSPVLDVKEKVPSLQILFKNNDIYAEGKQLSLIEIEIANKGDRALEKSAFDDLDPFRLVVSNGTLAGDPVVNSVSDERFKQPGVIGRTHISHDHTDVHISPIIIDQEEWLSIRFLILHSLEVKPSVTAAGKLANLPKLIISEKPIPTDWSWSWHWVTFAVGVVVGLFLALLLLKILSAWVLRRFIGPSTTVFMDKLIKGEELVLDAIRNSIKEEELSADFNTVMRLEYFADRFRLKADSLRQSLVLKNQSNDKQDG